jgi:hypothetical protein
MSTPPEQRKETAKTPRTTWQWTVYRTAVRLAVIVAFAVVVHLSIDWVLAQMDAAIDSNMMLLLGVLALLLVAYVLLIATPFVPGVEIGLSLMVLQGTQIVPYVYFATVLGLMLAFCVGQRVPDTFLRGIFADLRFKRGVDMIETSAKMTKAQRLAAFRSALPKRMSPTIVNYRYVVLALLINLPGNSVIGGGGGISLMAGLSRLFTLRGFGAMALIAVAPIPLMFLIMGPGYFEN